MDQMGTQSQRPVQPQYGPRKKKQAVGLATAAMVFGICGFLPAPGIICGLLGIVFGIVALTKRTTSKGMAIAGVAVGSAAIILTITLSMFLQNLVPKMLSESRHVVCQSTLQGLGISIGMYQSDYDGVFPTNLQLIVEKEYVSSDGLKCPSVESGGRNGYFFFPPNAGTDTHPDTILACDLKDNHEDEIRNVLMVSGNVTSFFEDDFQATLAKPHNAKFAAALRKAEGP